MTGPSRGSRVGAIDHALVLLALVGIYLEVAIRLSPTVPIPSFLAGIAGLTLIWRRRNDFSSRQFAALLSVVVVFLASILVAPGVEFLPKRFTGFVQLVYSLVIGFALYLTVLRGDRGVLSAMLLCFCLVILAGCILETYTGFRAISDMVRNRLYDRGVYESDLRDLLYYGTVRPKFFTSEPSAVTFSFSLFALTWFLITEHRYRMLVFTGLVAGGILIIPGPTTLLAAILAGLSLVILPDRGGGNRILRRLALAGTALVALVAVGVLGSSVYAERIDSILSGSDPSFFFRILGPALVGLEVIWEYPWTGVGLTAENSAREMAMNVFVGSSAYSANWKFENMSEVLTNYFWLHWIYLGLIFGILALLAITFWLRTLGVRHLAFCFLVWAVFGQASGAYVGPKTWIVLMLTAAVVTRVSMAPVPVGKRLAAAGSIAPWLRQGRQLAMPDRAGTQATSS